MNLFHWVLIALAVFAGGAAVVALRTIAVLLGAMMDACDSD